MNRISCFPVLTSFRNNQSQELSGLRKVLHQTPIEVHTAADVACAATAKASPSRPGNCTVPSCRPTLGVGIDPDGASQLVPGSGEGQNTPNNLKPIQVCKERDGALIQRLRVAGALAHRSVRVRRRTEFLLHDRGHARPMWLQLGVLAAPVPSSSMPWP